MSHTKTVAVDFHWELLDHPDFAAFDYNFFLTAGATVGRLVVRQ
jgi:hypothetical protein